MEKLLKLVILSFLMSTLSMASLFSQDDAIEYQVRLGNTTPGKIELAEFKAQEGVNIFIINSFTLGDMSVKSYDMTIVSKGEEPTSTTNQGGKFSVESQKQIQRLKKGDTIYFDRIIGVAPEEEKERKFPSIVFKII